jgi:CelD/BcsL family acetyltransferase involved in cellulose biosynthesis
MQALQMTPEQKTESERMLQVEEIRSLQEFEKVREEWRQLQIATGEPSILLSHPWFEVCATSLPADQQLLVLLLRNDGRLVGAAPLVKQRNHVRRMPVRQIRFLENPLTPFVDFLFVEPLAAFHAILAHFRKTHTDWDVLSLHKLREDSAHFALYRSVLQKEKWTFRESVVGRTPFLRIEQSWEDFYKSKSQKFRKTRRSVTNRVEALGPISIEQVTRQEDAALGLEQMLKVSEKSWTRREGADLLTAEFEKEFFQRLTKVASQAGWLRLWLLKKGNEALAAEYHIEDHGTAYGLRAHYDADFASSSPGAYLDTRIVQQLFQNGHSVYDMGPGMVGYKLAWTDTFYQCQGIDLYNPRFYSQFLGKLETRWIPALKESALWRWIGKTREKKTTGETKENKENDSKPANETSDQKQSASASRPVSARLE